MSENDELIDYDEDVAVAFMQNYLPQELKGRFSDDDLFYLLDLMCEFYEKNDYFNDDDEEKEERELIAFIIKEAKKNEIGDYTAEEIVMVLRAEEAYMATLDLPE
ncbi:MAG: hypothetical protein LBR67_04105 [Dysgonamonadaceae bacterium]|jgi:hypothetical protein|nr:hypothetical protein [Dysgonamonadaceae bacterium]